MNDGFGAECLLAALHGTSEETEGGFQKEMVGALLILDAFDHLKQIKRLLTPPKS